MNLLIIIDLQEAFINENTKEAISKIEKLIETNSYDNIIFTKFINSLNNPVYTSIKWDKCMSLESQRILIDTKEYPVFSKETYSILNSYLKDYLVKNDIQKIYLCGIDIECCVLVSAFNLFENNYDVYVLKDYCFSMNGKETYENAIGILKRNIGKDRVI